MIKLSRVCCTALLAMLVAVSSGIAEDGSSQPTPLELFDQRIMPIFRSVDPSSLPNTSLDPSNVGRCGPRAVKQRRNFQDPPSRRNRRPEEVEGHEEPHRTELRVAPQGHSAFPRVSRPVS